MTFTKKDADNFYTKADPWGFRTNPADAERKRRIIETITDLFAYTGLNSGDPPFRVLDLACGEGFITEDLPHATEGGVYGYEMSQKARGRWHKRIAEFKPSSFGAADKLRFDVIVITGALYPEYDWRELTDIAAKHIARNAEPAYVVVSHIADREHAPAIQALLEKAQLHQVSVQEFPYIRSDSEQFTQRLRVFQTDSSK